MDNDGRIILFGGVTVKDGEIPAYQGDLRQLETETMVWSKPSVSADEYPSARYGHSFSKLRSQLLLFGGWGNGGLQSRAENKKPGAESFFAYDPEVSPESRKIKGKRKLCTAVTKFYRCVCFFCIRARTGGFLKSPTLNWSTNTATRRQSWAIVSSYSVGGVESRAAILWYKWCYAPSDDAPLK